MNGSKKTSALTKEQFAYILDEFADKGDVRMELICLLLGRCIRIGDVIRTLKIDDLYTIDGVCRSEIKFKEEKTGKDRSITIPANSRMFKCATKHYESIKNLPRTGNVFYGQKTGRVLQDIGVKVLLCKFVGRRGIEQCSPHSFRKFGARYLHDSGVDIETISQMLNHCSVKETRTYLDIKTKDVLKAEARLVV